MISARSFAQAFAPRLRHRQCLPAVRPDPARGVAPFAVGLGAPRGGEAFTREATAARAASCRRPRIAAKDLVPPALPRRRPYAGDAAVGADEILIDVMAAPDEGRCVVSAVIARETGRIDGHAAAGNFRALAWRRPRADSLEASGRRRRVMDAGASDWRAGQAWIIRSIGDSGSAAGCAAIRRPARMFVAEIAWWRCPRCAGLSTRQRTEKISDPA